MLVANFMATPPGRVLRVLIGIALIAIGVYADKPLGYVLEVIGLIPIIAGALNICLICPLLGQSMRAPDNSGPK